ncbi:glycerophosphodiester phosphodiesterase [Streptomyces harbinensis]|uniref:glycerophosphodiester phosphodiesterase n=1 Tax=Streptomyces harbinensis TaxID=1176198 RepID=UPI0015904B8F|nr:glycerophosphodiester phosphodiesterase family protein [Streptomyces harbinensis]QKV68232.1 glycerophosphodiester phosphodiesterase [Streptomyces harbinensis]
MSKRPGSVVAAAALGVITLLLTVIPAGGAAAVPAADAPVTTASATPLIVAHRGASGYAPENTLVAADEAARLDTEWVEIDVQRTKDHQLIAMHDTTLARTTNAAAVFPDRSPWNVRDFTAREIARLDAGSWFGDEFVAERVPTLRQYLHRLTANDQKLLLEIKSPELYPGIERQILAELDRAGWLAEAYPGERVVLQSFSGDSVRTVHELAPEVKTGFLGTPPVAELPYYAEFSDQIGPRYTDLTAEYVAAIQAVDGVHGEPLEVNAWTINDGPTAARIAGLGVDGIITNFPDVVREAIGG